MKSTLIFSILLFLIISQAGDVFAQEKDTIRIKVVREINGERKTIDRTYTSREEMMNDPELKELQLNGDSTFLILRSGEGNFTWTTDSADQVLVVVEKMVNADGKRNLFISRDQATTIGGNGEHFILKGDSLDSNVFIFKTDEEGSEGRRMSWVTEQSPAEFRFFGKRRQMLMSDAEPSELQAAGIQSGKTLEPASSSFRVNTNEGSVDVTIELPKGDLLVKVTNASGGEIFVEERKNFTGVYSNSFNLSGQEAGTYFLQITQGSRSLIKKIIVR